jgi:RNA recognition motif-containing protein
MNLFIKNLHESINAFHLELMFKPYGEVLSTKVLYDRASGEHKGSGFVEMKKEEDALKAIEALDGKEIQGKALVIEKARPKKVNIWG